MTQCSSSQSRLSVHIECSNNTGVTGVTGVSIVFYFLNYHKGNILIIICVYVKRSSARLNWYRIFYWEESSQFYDKILPSLGGQGACPTPPPQKI